MSIITQRRNTAKATIDRAIHEALDTAWGGTRAVLVRLLRHVRSASDLLRPEYAAGREEAQGHVEILEGLVALAAHHEDWLRPVEPWLPGGQNPRPVFASLAQHLLAHFPVPALMTQVWFRGRGADARRQQGWYKHLGLGRNIRTADIPLQYTKAMAHQFVRAPAHLPIEQALRWGQVRGLGGSNDLARAVIATRLGGAFEEDEFWRSVVQYFVGNPGLAPARVNSIVDYLHDQKFVPRAVVTEDGSLEAQGPPQAGLTLMGRTIASLLRDVAAWHERREPVAGRPAVCWPRCGIGEFRWIEEVGDDRGIRLWTIRELLNNTALRVEGAAMHHCVARYVRRCADRRTTIWSMTIEDRQGLRRVLTIEVDPGARVIRQAKRYGNAAPNAKDRELLVRWAQQERLTIAESL